MTIAQRTAGRGLMDAILTVTHARAEALRDKVDPLAARANPFGVR